MCDERPVRLRSSNCAGKQSKASKACIVHDDRLPAESGSSGSGDTLLEVSRRSTRCPGKYPSALFAKDKCIFCSTCRKRKSQCQFENLTQCMSKSAEEAIKNAAAQKADCHILGMVDLDLIAREAMYHKTCYKAYLRVSEADQSQSSSGCAAVAIESDSVGKVDSDNVQYACDDGVDRCNNAKQDAFRVICHYVQENIIDNGCVERMVMLRERYVLHMQEHSPAGCVTDYRTSVLKTKLISHFGDKLRFFHPPNNRGDLVYAASLELGDAVGAAFEAMSSENRILREAAFILRRDISNAAKNSSYTEWPPSVSFLTSGAISPPPSLDTFLTLLFMGKSGKCSDRVSRLRESIGEDLCSATTSARWKMPKHILLGVSVHHLTGSAELVTVLNRFGHCANYSAVMEMETAMADSIVASDSVLPSNIHVHNNKFSHTVWDNFDVLEETPSGSGTTHSTHGIVIQEQLKDVVDDGTDSRSCHVIPSKKRSCTYSPVPLPVSFSKKHVEPSFNLASVPQCTMLKSAQLPMTFEWIWIICRRLLNEHHTVPDWNAWISLLSAHQVVTKSTVGYLAPVLQPITQYATVAECLRTSLKVSAELQQSFTFVTMDLAAARIAYDIIFDDVHKQTQMEPHSAGQSQSDLSRVIIHLGAFHTMCAYMGALGHMMAGSGFEEVLIEAEICASGSIDKVLSGKHFNRAMRVHQRMVEAVEQLLLELFQQTQLQGCSEDARESLSKLVSNANALSYAEAVASLEVIDLLNSFHQFRNDAVNGKMGLTAKVWMNYCDCVWILLRYQRAVKENDLDLFITSLRDMLPLLFAADRQNYARYIPLYYVQLLNLQRGSPEAADLLRYGGFSVARSTNAGCRIATDMTIEQTVNRAAKTQGGVIGITRRPSAYYRWCLTRNGRAEYLDATFDLAGINVHNDRGHKGTRPSEVIKSCKEVSNLKAAFLQFSTPFSHISVPDDLYCLSSGFLASSEVAADMTQFPDKGSLAAQNFLQSRIVDKTVPFHSPMKKLRLKTFTAMAVKKVAVCQKKSVQVKAERNLLGSILLLSQKVDIDLEKLFCYPMSPVPWSLATADGGLIKTDKAQLLHHIERKVDPDAVRRPGDASADVAIVDGNAIYQSLSHVPPTFGELAALIFRSFLPPLPVVHFVTDSYPDVSIKCFEQQRRGTSTAYRISGPKTKTPADWKSFLRHAANKSQLTDFLLQEWCTDAYAQRLQNRQVYFVCGEQCFLLSSSGLKTECANQMELVSNQQEADTRIILHMLYADKHSPQPCTLLIVSPDTDVFILLLYYVSRVSSRLLFETGTGNHRRHIHVQTVASAIGARMCTALPGLHCFTGCDTTSAFVRKGKRKGFDVLESALHSDVKSTASKATILTCLAGFEWLGSVEPTVSDNLLHVLQQFVCLLYGKSACSDVNKARYSIFSSRYQQQNLSVSSKSGIDLSLLPPCFDSLKMHCARAAYQTYIWRHAHESMQNVPSPSGHGWKFIGNELYIDWFAGSMLPHDVIELLSERSGIDDDAVHDVDLQDNFEEFEDVEEDDMVDSIVDVIFEEEDNEGDCY